MALVGGVFRFPLCIGVIPKTTFFLAWNWKWSLGRNRNTKQLLEHSWLVNREDLPEALRTR